jgi:hypothetical protein
MAMDQRADADGDDGFDSHVAGIVRRFPSLPRGGGVQKQIIGHDGGADQRDGRKQSVFGDAGDQSARHGSEVRGDSDAGDQKRQAHEHDQRHQEPHKPAQIAERQQQRSGDADQQRRPWRGGGHPESGKPQRGPADIAAFIGGIAKAQGGHDQQAHGEFHRRCGDAADHGLRQPLFAQNRDTRGGILQNDGRHTGKHQRPEQGHAKAHARHGASGDRAGANKGRRHQHAGAGPIAGHGSRLLENRALSWLLSVAPFASIRQRPCATPQRVLKSAFAAARLPMAIVAQLVRAPVCGTGGRGFKTRRSPHFSPENCLPSEVWKTVTNAAYSIIAPPRP